jgi:rhodanese-related sulfurtransferase
LARLLTDSRRVAVIDVRSLADFKGPLGHIAQARNLPLADVQPRLSELMPLRSEPVVLVCRTQKMSATAAAQLEAAGFSDVRILRGGMLQWNGDGHPVEDRAPDPQGGR